jgi:hypothetical protein
VQGAGDGKRDVPDVSLFASNGFNNSFYIICQSDAVACDLSSGQFSGFGGTSVSSPIFAGVMALINQKTGERQGNANYVFYKMAATASNSCNSATVASGSPNNCIFYDIPSGSTIAMPCTAGSPNCTVTTSGDAFGALSGYTTASGYDLATGLGSVNVTNLVNQWSTYAGQFKASKFSPFTLGPPATITHGQAIPVAAAVAPQTGTGTPTGTITLIADTGSSVSDQQGVQQVFALSSGSLPAGTTTTFLPGGTSYTVTAHYSGDSTFAPSDSSPAAVTVNPEASKTQAAIVTFSPINGAVTNSNATSIAYGSFYILRSNVTNASGNLCAPHGNQVYGCPTGTVTLTDTFNGSTNPLDGGSFTLNGEGYTEDQPIFLLGGQHSIVASYGGDASYTASNNSTTPDVVTVTKAPTTITLSPATQSAQAGIPVSVTATVGSQASLPPTPLAAQFPSSNVQFFVGGNPIALSPTTSVTYITGTSSTTGFAQLTAQLSTSALPFGSDTITAQFAGDSNYSQSAVSNSATVANLGTTSTTLTSSNLGIQHGTSVTFTAAVAPVLSGGPALTGTVSFTASGTPLGNPVSVVNGQAQVSSSSLPGGTILINSTYSGDTDYQASLGQLEETVQLLATTTTVTTSNAAIQQGTSVTLTAQVTPVHSGGPVLTGTVQFLSAVTSGGSTTPIGAPVNVSSGQAQLVTSSIPSGTQFVFGSYSGDSNYASSQAFISEQVTPGPDFGISFAPATVTVSSPGASGTTTLTVTGSNGYNGVINLSAASCSGLPKESSCSFSPASVTGSGTTTLTVSTTAPSALVPLSRHIDFGGWRTTAGALRLLLLCVAPLTLAIQARRRRWNLIAAGLTLTLLISVVACGGGGGGGVTPPTNPGTPVVQNQPINVMVTSGTITPTFTFTLNVN